MGFLQHLVGFADPSGRANINFQPAALGALDQLKKILGSLPVLGHEILSIRSFFERVPNLQMKLRTGSYPPTPECDEAPDGLH
jgi:hypothetical protein